MDDRPKITVEPGENLTGDIGDRYRVTALEYPVTFVLSRRSEQVERGRWAVSTGNSKSYRAFNISVGMRTRGA